MKIYFAPMEGLTDAIYRRVHRECFGGVAKYFMPFVCPGAGASLTARERADIEPAANAFAFAVPQILTRDAALFCAMAQRLADLGYTEVNLNAGCPVGTATGKGRGSGLLRDAEWLRGFLSEIFAHSPLPVSVKTRVGFSSPHEWPRLLAVYRDFPLRELIVHLRTREEMYRGDIHRELLPTLEGLPFPTVANGNLFAPADLDGLPGQSAAMLGRGLAANPALALGRFPAAEELRAFHDRLYAAYLRAWPEHAVVGRMHAVMGYLSHCFDLSPRQKKRLFRATQVEEYNAAAHFLFSECPMKPAPQFSQEPG